MNCIICNKEMNFTLDGDIGITFHSLTCLNENCDLTVYFDKSPFEEVSEYDLQFDMDNKRYGFTSTTAEWAEYITHIPLTTIIENDVEIIQLDYYVPFKEDINHYINFVKRIMNLKAFL